MTFGWFCWVGKSNINEDWQTARILENHLLVCGRQLEIVDKVNQGAVIRFQGRGFICRENGNLDKILVCALVTERIEMEESTGVGKS